MREIDGGGSSTEGAEDAVLEDCAGMSAPGGTDGVSTEVDGRGPDVTGEDPNELDERKEIWPETQSIDGL